MFIMGARDNSDRPATDAIFLEFDRSGVDIRGHQSVSSRQNRFLMAKRRLVNLADWPAPGSDDTRLS
jgi:hypothetical protein